jgi:hypothetical protein
MSSYSDLVLLESRIKLAHYDLNNLHYKITTAYSQLIETVDEAQAFKKEFTGKLRSQIVEFAPLCLNSMG